MPKAVIKGEAHTSKKDQQALLEIDRSQFDAVFLEYHDKNYFERPLTPGYALFCIGHIVYGATFGRVYHSTDDFRDAVEADNVPIYEVDADVYEVYEMIPLWKQLLFLLISPIFAALILGLILSPLQWGSQYIDPLLGNLLIVGAVLFLFGFTWAYAYFYLNEAEAMSLRDQHMADEIQRISAQNEFETVLMSCGDLHVSGIESILSENGWQAESHASQSWFSKTMRLPSRVYAVIRRPRKSLSRLRRSFF